MSDHDYIAHDLSKIIQQAKLITLGVPNDRMFPNTPEVSRWFSLYFRGLFGQFGGAIKTIYLFGCLRGTLVVTKALLLPFSSHLKVFATPEDVK